jgi:hypothetical protein
MPSATGTGENGVQWQVAIGCQKGTIRLHAVTSTMVGDSPVEVRRMDHSSAAAVNHCAFTPDGRNILAGGFDIKDSETCETP